MRLTEPSLGKLTASPDPEDRQGKIEVYELPDSHQRYVLGLDASNGVSGGDWTVAVVLSVDSGLQVAEYRAVIDPDLATDQIEALALWYNRALCAVEVSGGYGMPFLRYLLDRKSCPIYERVAFDKMERAFVKRPGWDTNVKTRPLLVSEMRHAVRTEQIQLRSLVTISECRTLHERKSGEHLGKIEARPGCHDDGFMAAGIAQQARLHIQGTERKREEAERKESSFVRRMIHRARLKDGKRSTLVDVRHVRPTHHGSLVGRD